MLAADQDRADPSKPRGTWPRGCSKCLRSAAPRQPTPAVGPWAGTHAALPGHGQGTGHGDKAMHRAGCRVPRTSSMHPAARPRPGQRSRGAGGTLRDGSPARLRCGSTRRRARSCRALQLHSRNTDEAEPASHSAWGRAAPVGLLMGRAAPWPPQPCATAHPAPRSPTQGAAAGTRGWGPGSACSPHRDGADPSSAPCVGSRK